MHITFNEFKSHMDYVSECHEAQKVLDSVFMTHRKACGDTVLDITSGADRVVDLLAGYFNVNDKSSKTTQLGSDILLWWIYSKDMGKSFIRGDIINDHLPDDHKFKTPVLYSLEDLYDYLLWLMNTMPPLPVTFNENGFHGYTVDDTDPGMEMIEYEDE